MTIEDLMMDFLNRNYPVQKSKNGRDKHFKRAIFISQSNVFFLGDKSNHPELIANLTSILVTVFSCPKATCSKVVKNFLSMR